MAEGGGAVLELIVGATAQAKGLACANDGGRVLCTARRSRNQKSCETRGPVGGEAIRLLAKGFQRHKFTHCNLIVMIFFINEFQGDGDHSIRELDRMAFAV
jgi:hypothetical protein